MGNTPSKVIVRQSDGPAFALIHKTLHRPPGIEHSHAAIVNDIAVLIPRILLVPRLKRKWSVTEIEVHIVEPEPLKTRLESRFDALGPMIGVPQLRGDKEVFTRNPAGGKTCLQRLAHFTFVLVSFRTIEVSKSSFQRVSGGTYCRVRTGNQGSKPEHGHMAGSVAQRYSLWSGKSEDSIMMDTSAFRVHQRERPWIAITHYRPPLVAEAFPPGECVLLN